MPTSYVTPYDSHSHLTPSKPLLLSLPRFISISVVARWLSLYCGSLVVRLPLALSLSLVSRLLVVSLVFRLSLSHAEISLSLFVAPIRFLSILVSFGSSLGGSSLFGGSPVRLSSVVQLLCRFSSSALLLSRCFVPLALISLLVLWWFSFSVVLDSSTFDRWVIEEDSGALYSYHLIGPCYAAEMLGGLFLGRPKWLDIKSVNELKTKKQLLNVRHKLLCGRVMDPDNKRKDVILAKALPKKKTQ
ncbi:hypothetical protein RIF29_39212 [Crotalaria pallida]|uniref:Uncharacterized protein n=1 Tax=Crotalaria pallida TaxID=3830 RepID=A0AAN9E2H6_CROPI